MINNHQDDSAGSVVSKEKNIIFHSDILLYNYYDHSKFVLRRTLIDSFLHKEMKFHMTMFDQLKPFYNLKQLFFLSMKMKRR